MRDTVSAGGMMAKETGIAMGSVFRAHDGPEEKEGMGKGDGLGDIAVPSERFLRMKLCGARTILKAVGAIVTITP